MSDKYTKNCSTSLIIRGRQSNAVSLQQTNIKSWKYQVLPRTGEMGA